MFATALSMSQAAPSVISPEDYIRVRGHAPIAPLFIRRPYVPLYSKVLNWTYRSVTFASAFVGLHLACLLPGFVAVRVKKIMVMRSEKKRIVEEEHTRLIAEAPIRTRAQFLSDQARLAENNGELLQWQKKYYRSILYPSK